MTRIRFEDLPSTNTPRNAENLNKLNNVVISSTEPTTGEEVWIQKGNNLFNKDNANILNCYFTSSVDTLTASSSYKTLFIRCNSNTTYTISKIVSNRFVVGYTTEKPAIGVNVYGRIVNNSATNITITTGNNAEYLCVYYYTTDDSSEQSILNSIKIEQNSSATTYEAYIDKKIYTKNDNGVYEEFYDESEMNKETYSTEEQVIGTWIDGKTLYRKVVELGNLPNNSSKAVNHNINNLDIIVKLYGIANSSSSSLPLPFSSVEAINNSIQLTRASTTTIRITTGTDRSSLIGYATIEYTKTTD